MKSFKIKQFDEKEEEIADALISLGLGRSVARTLAYLQNLDEATSFELETGTVLRQPVVSIAIKQLKEWDWVNEREEKRPGKGRSYKIYSLKAGFNDIIAHLETQRKKDFNETMATIKRLKEFGKD
ncbi:MAG: ArsR family transcriptional regulator [Candidatus Methanoperedens sp.]|nr:ArsR family transcriptional regulator [Candidatus Methanoperedens sp.]MCE8429207.1 ArsR family transcriptional regulator [Candidatus Methanoperedens sp.]